MYASESKQGSGETHSVSKDFGSKTNYLNGLILTLELS